MKIVITGHKGYIGRQVFFLLKMLGHKPIGYDLESGRDIRNGIEKCDVLIHLAAKKSGSDVYEYNIETTKSVINSCKKIVFASTVMVYGETSKKALELDELHPVSEYAKSKKECEDLIIKSKKIYSILRLTNVYSLDDESGIVGKFLKGNNVILGDGKKVRDYIRLEDIVPVIVEAVSCDKWDGVFNISTGRGLTINEIHKRISKDKRHIIYKKEVTNEATKCVANNLKANLLNDFNPIVL